MIPFLGLGKKNRARNEEYEELRYGLTQSGSTGWVMDKKNGRLTLNGFHCETDRSPALLLPDGIEVILNGENYIAGKGDIAVKVGGEKSPRRATVLGNGSLVIDMHGKEHEKVCAWYGGLVLGNGGDQPKLTLKGNNAAGERYGLCGELSCGGAGGELHIEGMTTALCASIWSTPEEAEAENVLHVPTTTGGRAAHAMG